MTSFTYFILLVNNFFQINLFSLSVKIEMKLLLIYLLFIGKISCLIYRDEIIVLSKEIEEINDEDQNPYSPLVLCHFL